MLHFMGYYKKQFKRFLFKETIKLNQFYEVYPESKCVPSL